MKREEGEFLTLVVAMPNPNSESALKIHLGVGKRTMPTELPEGKLPLNALAQHLDQLHDLLALRPARFQQLLHPRQYEPV